MAKRQFIVTIEGDWLDGDKKVTTGQVATHLRWAVKHEFQYLAKRTSVKRIPRSEQGQTKGSANTLNGGEHGNR